MTIDFLKEFWNFILPIITHVLFLSVLGGFIASIIAIFLYEGILRPKFLKRIFLKYEGEYECHRFNELGRLDESISSGFATIKHDRSNVFSVRHEDCYIEGDKINTKNGAVWEGKISFDKELRNSGTIFWEYVKYTTNQQADLKDKVGFKRFFVKDNNIYLFGYKKYGDELKNYNKESDRSYGSEVLIKKD